MCSSKKCYLLLLLYKIVTALYTILNVIAKQIDTYARQFTSAVKLVNIITKSFLACRQLAWLKCKSWYGLSLVPYFWAGFIPGMSLRGCMLHKRKKILDFQPCIKNWNLSFYEESRKMWRSPYQPRYWFFQIECHCYGESKNGKVTIGLLYSPSSAPLFPYHWNMICVSIICIIKQSAAD